MDNSDSISGLDPLEIAIVTCGTTAGEIVMEFHREWSPHGYDRAVSLFEQGFYDHSHFFRTVPNFLVQFGISYSKNDALQQLSKTHIHDDPQLNPPIPFNEGTISYAGNGPNSRTSQLFISLREDGGSFGKELWETPIGKVVVGMKNVVHNFYSGYGDMPPWGQGPIQGKIHAQGATYIEQNFPKLSRFDTCHVHRKDQKQQQLDEAESHLKNDNLHRLRDRSHIDHNNIHRKGEQRSMRSQHHRNAAQQQQHHHHHQQQEQHHYHEGEHVAGQLHHQHSVHFNAAPDEEGLTKLSFELLSSCLLLFLAVLIIWLQFVLSSPKKSRKTS